MKLNASALRRCEQLIERASARRVVVERGEGGARLIDCGVDARGGLEAGRAMAEICLADLGRVDFVPGDPNLWPGIAVTVSTDQPVAACMASQYAGWPIGGEKFFAMGSGPMRAVRGREELFERIGHREQSEQVIGVLESSRMPHVEICIHVAEDCGVEPRNVTLLIAPTSSIAGTVQVVARSVETTLHKMYELGFDITKVNSGFGVAPLPPVAADDLTGIGRTNDAVLYGGQVTLWVDDADKQLQKLGPKIPSSASGDHGQPFADIFAKYDRDFYKIDPLLFSPAEVTLISLQTGHTFRYGETNRDILHHSFSS